MKIQIELVDKWFPDAIPLLYDHWQELGLDTDLKGDIDIDKMRALENVGIWYTITVRDGDKLAGYLLALVSTHLHYKSSPPMLIVDAYYIKPEYRNGVGVRLLKFTEAFAKEKGCIKLYLTCKVHQDHSALFEALGYRLSDYAFTKRI